MDKHAFEDLPDKMSEELLAKLIKLEKEFDKSDSNQISMQQMAEQKASDWISCYLAELKKVDEFYTRKIQEIVRELIQI